MKTISQSRVVRTLNGRCRVGDIVIFGVRARPSLSAKFGLPLSILALAPLFPSRFLEIESAYGDDLQCRSFLIAQSQPFTKIICAPLHDTSLRVLPRQEQRPDRAVSVFVTIRLK